MALFTRGLADPSFTPLFRLLNDFDAYSREVQGGDEQSGSVSSKHRAPAHLISPKFDLHETKETYELHGELPGIERDNVTIEFTDPQTLVIRGHVERTYSSGTPPASKNKSVAIAEGGEEHHDNSHKATVEDEAAAAAKEGDTNDSQVVKHGNQKSQPAPKPVEKFWVSERSFGQFSRAFSFPTRVEQESVRASLNNGILNVSIPKAKKQEARRIAIN